MSGILGLIHKDKEPMNRDLFLSILRYLTYRGPDEKVMSVRPNEQTGFVCLGHTLLRTTNQSNWEQGFCVLDNRFWIVADARIDGRIELMESLYAAGKKFEATIPDAELILHAYDHWGIDFLEHIIGDFAFILWDETKQRIITARDHFGVVPLFYADVKGKIIISNTINAVRMLPEVSEELNEETISDFLLFRSNFNETTSFFKDIHRVPAGHYLVWEPRHQLQLKEYSKRSRRDEVITYKYQNDYHEHFLYLLKQAVSDRVRTDNVSVLMSGGLDSPAVAALLKQWELESGQQLTISAFTSSYSVIRHDEKHYAKLVAEFLDISHYFPAVENRFGESPPEMPETISPEPGYIFQFWLNPWKQTWEDVSKKSKVILTGHGGDALFQISTNYWFDNLKSGNLSKIVKDIYLFKKMHGRRPPFYLRGTFNKLRRKLLPGPEIPEWLKREYSTEFHLEERFCDIWTKLQAKNDGPERLVGNPFWSNMLSSWDPNNTSYPMKFRFPFCDLRLLQYLERVPPLQWFQQKYILRRAMAGLLPEAVLKRKKTFLTESPIQGWTRKNGLPNGLYELLEYPEAERYFNMDILAKKIKTPGKDLSSKFLDIMKPLMLLYWLRYQNRVFQNQKQD